MPEHREPEATYERTIARLTAQRDALVAALKGLLPPDQTRYMEVPRYCILKLSWYAGAYQDARAALDALEEA